MYFFCLVFIRFSIYFSKFNFLVTYFGLQS
uniref:Uncharacterized protein n=1 Tax=Rhizophora mucronata TaxID=61149 RepID=A0A2P2QAN3_RHIMU